MRETPYDLYRPPAKVDDGEGGFTEVLVDGKTIWGVMAIYENETRILIDEREDVRVGDIIVVEES